MVTGIVFIAVSPIVAYILNKIVFGGTNQALELFNPSSVIVSFVFDKYKLQEVIKQKEQELKKLKDQYDQDINELINTDHIETKYYKINEIRRSGRSFINIPKFQELYNNEFNKVVKYSVTITDAKKVLSGDQVEKIIDKYNDTVLYEIIKKV